ncbi:hypothetical protein Anas_10229 [Armadillidium nasatum]|uniref:Uncharacterized protein n=1 Tax=Armadillidium nasatum TaxID=96803 RepID=A0A5N5T4E9_9CRUS|nr:hypothetical protein Anas_10229 [Armadillidium nasatum]
MENSYKHAHFQYLLFNLISSVYKKKKKTSFLLSFNINLKILANLYVRSPKRNSDSPKSPKSRNNDFGFQREQLRRPDPLPQINVTPYPLSTSTEMAMAMSSEAQALQNKLKVLYEKGKSEAEEEEEINLVKKSLDTVYQIRNIRHELRVQYIFQNYMYIEEIFLLKYIGATAIFIINENNVYTLNYIKMQEIDTPRTFKVVSFLWIFRSNA